ncbi:hypothetical protein CAEBREN_25782 [Caenorhabditis brenneri]|uniref:Uncharacterized protein n=1 Tax=Caenorhabditis brenneri TaxID=135651 RepID=G0NF77_CAEBE|nr:hypothetical protein CAEBREN_25782 [Caenorhabditis brenneri]
MDFDRVHKVEEKIDNLAKEMYSDRNPEELLTARGAPAAVEKPFPPTSKVIAEKEVKETPDGGKEEVEFCLFSSKKQ